MSAIAAERVLQEWRAGRMLRLDAGTVLTTARLEAAAYRELIDLLAWRAGARDHDWCDARGRRTSGHGPLASAARLVAEAAAVPALYAQYWAAAHAGSTAHVGVPTDVLDGSCLYLRMDHAFDLLAGGSIAHTAGVINGLRARLARVSVLSTDRVATVDVNEDFHELVPRYGWGRNVPGFPLLAFSAQVLAWVRAHDLPRPRFIYARYSHGNHAALSLRRMFHCPYVCEYNGSAIWISRQWGGRRLRFERLFWEIEQRNLLGADLVIAVSDASADELRQRGVDDARILINPNGVDTDVFSPALNGSAVRRALDIGPDETVYGFVGTFGAWHGTDILAQAFVHALDGRAPGATPLRLLMIGDGLMAPRVRELLGTALANGRAVMTGIVPQAEAPGYLAACDVLVSPHVGNPDGSPFFGSPTKLFEYMAAGRAIVASRLDQVGQVLENDVTALLVPPGDVAALAEALLTLADDAPRRAGLGQAARATAVQRHTWQGHVDRILSRLRDMSAGSSGR